MDIARLETTGFVSRRHLGVRYGFWAADL